MTTFPAGDRDYVVNHQYKTDANLAARQSIYRFQQPRVEIYATALGFADLQGDEAVLDIGCGNGGYLAELQRRGHRGPVIGFDLSPGMLAAARPVATAAALGIADAEYLPVADDVRRWRTRDAHAVPRAGSVARATASCGASPGPVARCSS